MCIKVPGTGQAPMGVGSLLLFSVSGVVLDALPEPLPSAQKPSPEHTLSFSFNEHSQRLR